MATKIQKWGNSLAVRIPKEVAGGFTAGRNVVVRREGDALIVRHEKKIKFTLKELVDNIDAKNAHKASDWGKAKGKELW